MSGTTDDLSNRTSNPVTNTTANTSNASDATQAMSSVYKTLPKVTKKSGMIETVDITFAEWIRLQKYWKRGVYLPGEKCSYIELAIHTDTERNGPMEREKLLVHISTYDSWNGDLI